MAGGLIYNSDILLEQSILQLRERYMALLRAIADDPARIVGKLVDLAMRDADVLAGRGRTESACIRSWRGVTGKPGCPPPPAPRACLKPGARIRPLAAVLAVGRTDPAPDPPVKPRQPVTTA